MYLILSDFLWGDSVYDLFLNLPTLLQIICIVITYYIIKFLYLLFNGFVNSDATKIKEEVREDTLEKEIAKEERDTLEKQEDFDDEVWKRDGEEWDVKFGGYEFTDEFIKKYSIDDGSPAMSMIVNPPLFKQDITGLMAWLDYYKNMQRLFKELTFAIRKGDSVETYLIKVNWSSFMSDKEVRSIVVKGFGDIATLLLSMLKIEENNEMRKDYNACMEAISILEKIK